jgi:hypothetical protein
MLIEKRGDWLSKKERNYVKDNPLCIPVMPHPVLPYSVL